MHLTQVETRSILTPTGGFLAGGYTHSLNPAFGCAYGKGFCGQFCYARCGMAHRFYAGGGEWGDYLAVKTNAATLLAKELERAAARLPTHKHHVSKLAIFASSSTDPCATPVLPVFDACLRELAKWPIRRVVVQTRAPAVVRLREVIESLGERGVVSISLETDSDDVFNIGPSGSPSIAARRRAIEEIRRWNTRLHIAISPILPMLRPDEFADWVAANCDDATVDTFVSGDGAGGARTATLPLPQIFADRGWDWRGEDDGRAFFEKLVARMGTRVGWSCDGFRRLAAE